MSTLCPVTLPTMESLTIWLLTLDPRLTLVVGALLSGFAAYRLGRLVGSRRARSRSHEGSRRALAGKTAEQWSPYLPGFPGRVTEARFLGAPIDFVLFEGIDEGYVEEIVFVEVKSGRGQLSAVERSVRDCVLEGRIAWVEHRVEPPS